MTNNLSVIRQKVESQNRCFKKKNMPNVPKNKHFLPPDIHACVSGGKKCSFCKKFGVLYFLETPVLRQQSFSNYHCPFQLSFWVLMTGIYVNTDHDSCTDNEVFR